MIRFFSLLINKRREFNNFMARFYSPIRLTIVVMVAVLLLAIIILFIPPYIGISDDGSFDLIMRQNKLRYSSDQTPQNYFQYYVPTMIQTSNEFTEYEDFSSHNIIVKFSILANNFLGQNDSYDLRFLALIYTFFYIPSVGLVVYGLLKNVKRFLEGFVFAIFAVVVFADVAIICFFPSFYLQPFQLICMMYCTGFALNIDNGRFKDLFISLYTLFSIVLVTAGNQFFISGFILALFPTVLLVRDKKLSMYIKYAASSILIIIACFYSFISLSVPFQQESHFHAMSRGVMPFADNPEVLLTDMGIEKQYSVLNGLSIYDITPLTRISNQTLKENFLDKYSTFDVLMQYFKRPNALISMLDQASQTSFYTRSEFSGNYEQSNGRSPMAKSLFWSGWSSFKIRSLPHSIGFVVLLGVLILFLFRNKKSSSIKQHNDNIIYRAVLLGLLLMGIVQSVVVFINCGDMEFSRYNYILSIGIDIVSFFVFTSLVDTLNILSDKEEK